MYTRNPSLGGGTPGGCYTMLYDVYEEPVVGGRNPRRMLYDVIRCIRGTRRWGAEPPVFKY